MGQTRSALSHSTATRGRAKWKAGETARRLRIRTPGSGQKAKSDQLNRNPMKNKVLSYLGRRKRDSSQGEADLGGGNAAGDPATRRGHRVGKLPRDEVVSAVGEQRAAAGCFDTPSGLDGNTEPTQHAVNREATAGSSDAPGLESKSCEVRGAGCEEPKPVRKDNASDPQTRAMEDKPLGGSNHDPIVSQDRVLTGNSTLSSNSPPLKTSDPDTEGILSSLASDQLLDCGLSIRGDQAEATMTKTDCSTVSCTPKATGKLNNSCPVETKSQTDSDQTSQSPPGGQCFPGTIPKLIITRDPSPNRSQVASNLLRTEPNTGCLEPQPDDESPCSDSGCGGSPALMRSPRKLSNSSSIGLSSASSFEESEDDFTGSDIESSRSLCSPEDGTGVSVYSSVYSSSATDNFYKVFCSVVCNIFFIHILKDLQLDSDKKP